MRLSRAMIFVKNLDRMADFYSRALALTPVNGSRTELWAEFEAGGVSFALHAIPAHIADAIQIEQLPRVREENPIKLTFEVDDLGAAMVRLHAQGAMLIERPWNAYEPVDPEGNVFQICQA